MSERRDVGSGVDFGEGDRDKDGDFGMKREVEKGHGKQSRSRPRGRRSVLTSADSNSRTPATPVAQKHALARRTLLLERKAAFSGLIPQVADQSKQFFASTDAK